MRMEWRPDGWSVSLPVLIFPCTIKSRSSLLAPALPGGPAKRAVNGCGVVVTFSTSRFFVPKIIKNRFIFDCYSKIKEWEVFFDHSVVYACRAN